jgi:hypothetical protein
LARSTEAAELSPSLWCSDSVNAGSGAECVVVGLPTVWELVV